ncbi:anti-anti-sigma factor [Catenulispora sp. GP43]|uniref:STAS domain-containing protein n=1 Tax=Catenulispora sp. GP43 TaxID=3156263 RepID=UPI0035145021
MTELAVEPILGDDGATVLGLSVRGVLDHDNAEEFLEAFRAALPHLREAGGDVRIDCADVHSCDYAGLSALLMARREAAETGAQLILERQSPQLAALLAVGGVSDLLSPGEAADAEDGEQDFGSDQAFGSDPGGGDPGDEPPEVAVTWHGPVPVITLAGQVDLDRVEDITAAFAEAREGAPQGRTVVDLSRLEFADSTTLHVLLQARAASELVLVGPLRPQVRLLFQVTDLIEVFHFADGLDPAIGSLGLAP